MTRAFNNGRQSEVVFNEELTHLFKTLDKLNYTPPFGQPDADYEGKVWIDKTKGNQIKVSRNNKWDLCFKNEIGILAHIGDKTAPPSPVNTQLWVDKGVLKYYDPSEGWKIMKADTSGAAALSNFADFIYNNAHNPEGKVIIDEKLNPPQKYYQYLTPNAVGDKVFLSQGFIRDEVRKVDPDNPDKEVIVTDGKVVSSNVSVDLKQSFVKGEQVNTVHVNPDRLNNISRQTILLDGITKNFPLIHDNTEFYGIKNGTGLFLRENFDYETSPYGIELYHPENYDFLHAIKYEFTSAINTPGRVTVIKEKTGTQVKIPLGYKILEKDYKKLAIFIKGLYIDESYIDKDGVEHKNYELDESREFIKVHNISNHKSLLAVAALLTNNKYSGSITVPSGQSEVEVPFDTIPISFIKPIIFVRGIQGYKTFEYEITPTGYLIKGVTDGKMEFVMIDVDIDNTGLSNKHNMFVESKLTPKDNIKFNQADIADDVPVILWGHGILLSKPDVERDNVNHTLAFDDYAENIDYLLLRDPDGKMLINDYVSPTALFCEDTIGDAVVYSENFLLLNDNDLFTIDFNSKASANNEIKNYRGNFYSYIRERKYFYKEGDLNKNISLNKIIKPEIILEGFWYPLDLTNCFLEDIPGESPEEKQKRLDIFNKFKTMMADKLVKIKEAQVGYHVYNSYVDIVNGIDNQNITSYCYHFTNSIDEPLQVGHIDFDKDEPYKTEYQLNLRHYYENNTNGLSVFLDGYKQYANCEKGDTKTIVLPRPIGLDNVMKFFNDNPIEYQKWKDRTGLPFYTPKAGVTDISYIVEPLETGEVYACQRDILDKSNRVESSINTYRSNISLFPGHVTIFLGGLRIPKESIRILSSNIFTIDIDNNIAGTDRLIKEKLLEDNYILVEVRNDYSIKETTMTVERAGQITFDAPIELTNSKDTILIYINGLFYGSDYYIDKVHSRITITNNALINKILGENKIGDIPYPNIESNLEKYFVKHPDEKIKYPNYNPNFITFEWR